MGVNRLSPGCVCCGPEEEEGVDCAPCDPKTAVGILVNVQGFLDGNCDCDPLWADRDILFEGPPSEDLFGGFCNYEDIEFFATCPTFGIARDIYDFRIYPGTAGGTVRLQFTMVLQNEATSEVTNYTFELDNQSADCSSYNNLILPNTLDDGPACDITGAVVRVTSVPLP